MARRNKAEIVEKTIEKKRYLRWRHKLHGATEDYFNLDGENAIFVARIGLPLRLQSVRKVFKKFARLGSSFEKFWKFFIEMKVGCTVSTGKIYFDYFG